jgi:phosphate acetyltransferase
MEKKWCKNIFLIFVLWEYAKEGELLIEAGKYVSDLFAIIKQRLKGKELKIVFPEGTDERILITAGRLAAEGLLKPILIGDGQAIQKKADELKVSIAEIEVLDPRSYVEMNEAVSAFVDRCEGKVSKGEAENILLDENYFGTMLGI